MARVVSFIIRKKNIIPELLCIEHPHEGLILPEGVVHEDEDPRRAALRIATRHTDLGNFSSIAEVTGSGDMDRRFYKLIRNEPPGALGYWRHVLSGVMVRVRWMHLDGDIPLDREPAAWLAEYEPQLLE